ncbi:unnamed protein product [Adineta steineri]|uniref:Uncharacterized protein n=2 Tax=Adineta steineri TaxID=433720 RepID=A0A819SF17_9BILA|nr:unnamed protein product [Adineta steineri]CAF4061910.1 unnamed protein product [Adineta steineri]
MAIPEGFQPKEKKARRDYMCEYMGEWGLRDLLYFDVGRCFAFDTLHNLYRGSFRQWSIDAKKSTDLKPEELLENLLTKELIMNCDMIQGARTSKNDKLSSPYRKQ